jgi:hypothetical protein
MSARLMTRLTLALLLVTALIGCTDSTSPDSSDHFTGQFDLTHAEALPLPATVFEGNITSVTPAFHLRIVATSGSIVISPNGHYEQRVQWPCHARRSGRVFPDRQRAALRLELPGKRRVHRLDRGTNLHDLPRPDRRRTRGDLSVHVV